MHPLLLDVETAAQRLGVSAITFRRRLAAGDVVGSKIGNQWRFWAPTLVTGAAGPGAGEHVAQELLPVGWIEPGMVDLEQLAELLGIAQRTLAELVRDGELPAGKLGRQWRAYWPVIRDRIAAGERLGAPVEESPQ